MPHKFNSQRNAHIAQAATNNGFYHYGIEEYSCLSIPYIDNLHGATLHNHDGVIIILVENQGFASNYQKRFYPFSINKNLKTKYECLDLARRIIKNPIPFLPIAIQLTLF